jgi:hypothetical protein
MPFADSAAVSRTQLHCSGILGAVVLYHPDCQEQVLTYPQTFADASGHCKSKFLLMAMQFVDMLTLFQIPALICCGWVPIRPSNPSSASRSQQSRKAWTMMSSPFVESKTIMIEIPSANAGAG